MGKALDAAKLDAQGFLHITGTFGRVGVLDYPEKGYRKYISASVLKAAADSIVGLPVVFNHPEDGNLLKPETVKQYTVGAVTSATFDGFYIKGKLTIWDKDAIKAASSTHQQLSLGYNQKLTLKPGKTSLDNLPYEYVVDSIAYNHLAICQRARAGESARLNWAQDGRENQPYTTKKAINFMRKLIINEAVYEVDSAVYDAYIETKNQVKTLDQEKASLQAKVTAAMDAHATLETQKKDFEEKYLLLEEKQNSATDSVSVTNAEFKSRLDTWAVVGFDSAIVALDAELTSVEIKRKYLKGLLPDRSEAFDSYSDTEITAYWQVAADLGALKPPTTATDAKMMKPVRDGYSDKDMAAHKGTKAAFDAKYPPINQLMAGSGLMGYSFTGHSSTAITPTANVYAAADSSVAADEAGVATIRVQKRF